MQSLSESLKTAQANSIALGHFNFSTLEVLHAIVAAARDVDVPVVVGVSEGERDFVGLRQAQALVASIRQETGHPVFINADHTHTLAGVIAAIDAGFDAVIADGASLTKEENIQLVKQAVEYAGQVNPNILVEAEIGYIGTSSSVLDHIPNGASVTPELMPTTQEITSFIQATSAHAVAPAVGNIHGILKHSANPVLNIGRIREITSVLSVPVVLHGGSGLTDQNFTDAIKAGISLIHINTEIRLAWKNSLAATLTSTPDEISPYKLLEPSYQAVKASVTARLRLFSGK
jgi:fructose-bisphosphate aldolase class II